MVRLGEGFEELSAEGVRGGDAGEESGDVATGFDSVASLAGVE